MPRVRIGFSGHQGLSPETELLVRNEIERELKKEALIEGVCSLAEGSDQLFAKCVLDCGGQLMVVIPSEGYEQTFKAPEALVSFERLLTEAFVVSRLDYEEPSEEAFWAAGQRVVQDSDRLIAVWDGGSAGGLGGTADVVAYAKERGKDVLVVWPQGAKRRQAN